MKAPVLALVTLIATSLGAVSAQAAGSRCPDQYLNPNSTVSLRSYSLDVSEGETESIELCRSFRIHKLYIQAEGYYSDAYAQVLVNGNVKGTLYVPGRDPHYVVTVEDTASSIEFAAIRGSFRIVSLSAVLSESDGGFGGGYNPYPDTQLPSHVNTQMGQISSRVIWLVNQLENYTNYRIYGQYLLPIRKAAAEALAMSEARGDASSSARAYYERLLTTLDAAAPYIDDAFEVDYAFNLAVELMSKREQIRRVLQ
ncbi:MAG: hypothetical protein NDJ90_10630 [Oligoflexia bacterium]|nr:hypothetical protein [Oligoflexia bacterium]